MGDPWREIQAEIEEAASQALAPDSRREKLRRVRDRLESLLGSVDKYMGDVQLGDEASRSTAVQRMLRARQNADIREEMLGRGAASAEQLDAMGYVSHSELDSLSREGLLEAFLEQTDAVREHAIAEVVPELPSSFDGLVNALRKASFGDFESVLSELREGHGFEQEGEPAADEAIVLTHHDGRRVVVTFEEDGGLYPSEVEVEAGA